jgi:DNA-binding transcriptional LysR family regulator
MSGEQLPHLPTFVLAAELESFTAAARALKITQAAVSQRIHQLEASVGIGLFHRFGGRISLTNAGRKLQVYAKRIIELHSEARTVILDMKSELRGVLSIAASSVPGSHLLPTTVAQYRRIYPQVKVSVRISDSEDVMRRVEEGKADVGFAGDTVASPHLIFEPFAEDELALVVPANHRLSERRRIGIRDLIQEPMIQREDGSGSRHCLELALRRVGLDLRSLKVVLEVDGNEAVKEAVLQGLGVAVLSRRSIQDEVLKGTVRAIPITGFSLTRSLYVVRNRRHPLSAAAQAFLTRFQFAPACAS